MIVVDVETSGLDTNRDEIISIGAVDFTNPKATFYQEVRLPEHIKLSEEVLTITGFSLASLTDKGKPKLSYVVESFLKWTQHCSERTLAGENPWFDILFLRRAFNENQLVWPFGHRYVDLHSLGYANLVRRGMLPIDSNAISGLGLDKILTYVGLQPRSGPHNALSDAKLEAEALSRLIFGKPLIDDYANLRIPLDLAAVIQH